MSDIYEETKLGGIIVDPSKMEVGRRYTICVGYEYFLIAKDEEGAITFWYACPDEDAD